MRQVWVWPNVTRADPSNQRGWAGSRTRGDQVKDRLSNPWRLGFYALLAGQAIFIRAEEWVKKMGRPAQVAG